MLLKNLTTFPFATKATSRAGKQLQMSLAVRGSFTLRHDAPAELVVGDFDGDLRAQGSLSSEQMHPDDDDRVGEAICPDDLADFKSQAEVMLRGSCHAPGNQPVTSCLVTFSVGEWAKALRVTGPRAWSDRALGAVMSEPLPFRAMPIGYANSFGGEGYAANPSGKGASGSELPNVEDPNQLITAPSSRPAEPAGFGPLNAEWPQRRTKRGRQYGGDYQKKRAPFYSEDFDWSYFQCAPADQQLAGYLQGDEEMVCTNLHPEHAVMRCRLPGLRVRVFYRLAGDMIRELPMRLDTLFVDTDTEKLLLTWRGLANVTEMDLTDVSSVLIASEPLGEKKPAKHYHAILEAHEADPLGLASPEIKALEAQREAGLARLDDIQAASEELGTHGEDGLADDVGRLLSAAGTDEDTIAKARDGVIELVKVRRERRPDDTDYATAILEQKKATKVPAPVARKMPEPGKPPTAPPMPELVAAVEDALLRAEEADREVAKGLDQATQLPEALVKPPVVADHLTPLRELVASELFDGLRAPPFIEPGPRRDLSRQDYRGWDLSGRDLSGSDMREAQLSGANLSNANLRGAQLDHAVLYQANLRGADLSLASLKLTNFTEADAEGAVLAGVKLDTTFLDDACLIDADLSGASGTRALVRRSDLRGAKLAHVDLFECFFDGSTFVGAHFADAVLRSCLFQSCTFTKASFERALLTRTSFFSSDARNASFSEARGERVVFLKAKVDGCDFSRAVLPDCFFNEASAVRTRFFGANLKGANFYRCTLDKACFERANLFRADLRKSVLHEATFREASLFEASLLDAGGRGVVFDGANLTRCRTPS